MQKPPRLPSSGRHRFGQIKLAQLECDMTTEKEWRRSCEAADAAFQRLLVMAGAVPHTHTAPQTVSPRTIAPAVERRSANGWTLPASPPL